MEKDEVLQRLERIPDGEVYSREECDRLVKCGKMSMADADRHVSACNRNASALILAIELVRVHLDSNANAHFSEVSGSERRIK